MTSGNAPGDSVTMGASHPGTISLCLLRVSVSQSGDAPHNHRLLIHLLLRFPWCCRLWRWILPRGWCRSTASCACRCKSRAVWILWRCCPGRLHHLPKTHADTVPGSGSKQRLSLFGILAGLHPDAFLPMQNKHQPEVWPPAASYAAVQRVPAPQAHYQFYKLPRSALRRHKPACPYASPCLLWLSGPLRICASHMPYSSSRIRHIIPEVLLFWENCQHQRKSAVLRFESRITITTFYLKNSGMLLLPFVSSKWELSLRNHLSFHDLSCLFMVSCVISVYIWVVCKDTCPRKFLTTISGTPASSIWVAVVCLMECGV